jgi:aspartate kinase
MKIKVLKFGGTSVGDAQCFRRAIEIATRAAQESSVVVVVSAMSGVTNRLIAAAHQAAQGDETGFRQLAKSLEQGHGTAISELVRDGARQKELFEEIQSITTEMSNIVSALEKSKKDVLNRKFDELFEKTKGDTSRPIRDIDLD